VLVLDSVQKPLENEPVLLHLVYRLRVDWRNMSKREIPTWLLLIVVSIGLLLLIPALWLFVSLTATPVHPNPESVPTAVRAAPLPKWASAAKQGRQIVRAGVAGQNLPGVSVAVGIDGDIAWAEGFGFADLKTSAPVTPDHRFRIGTTSTVLTSAAAGLLLEKGRLQLDDRIQTYVPAFPEKQWPVTLRELMAHTAGVIPNGGDGGPLFTRHCERPAEALRHFADHPLLFQPGTRYRYSSYGWILVSAAVEAAADQPFLTFMREQIFDPLGMRDTGADLGPDPAAVKGEDFPLVTMIRELIYDPEAARDTTADATKKPGQDQVTPYFTRFRSDPNYGMHLMRPLDYSCYAGASVFVSSPSDLVRFGMAMNTGKLLKPATIHLLQKSQRLASGEETGYGLGWRLETVTLAGKQTRVIGHHGDSLGGMVASLMTFPAYGIAVAVTSNISFADTSSLAVRIAQAFAEQGRSPAPR
jgi:CubicO group peptidase (beta-lactamase class C family)